MADTMGDALNTAPNLPAQLELLEAFAGGGTQARVQGKGELRQTGRGPYDVHRLWLFTPLTLPPLQLRPARTWHTGRNFTQSARCALLSRQR